MNRVCFKWVGIEVGPILWTTDRQKQGEDLLTGLGKNRQFPGTL